MQIIQPHTKQSKHVSNWGEIKDEASQLLELVNVGNFGGRWQEAFSIAHSQVSTDPYTFFCVHNKLKDEFDTSVVVNPKIILKEFPTSFKEACMSYPHRPVIKTKRWSRITVEYECPKMGWNLGVNLKKVTKTFEGLPAFIIQHEIDHFHGENIYSKFKR